MIGTYCIARKTQCGASTRNARQVATIMRRTFTLRRGANRHGGLAKFSAFFPAKARLYARIELTTPFGAPLENPEAKSFQRYSYLKSVNAEYIDEMYQRYLENPDSIESSWRFFFE